MLNVGFSELLLIAAVALVAIGPKEMPGVLRSFLKAMRDIQQFGDGIKRQMREVIDETGVESLHASTIIDLEGKKQIAYDVADLEKLAAAKEVPRE